MFVFRSTSSFNKDDDDESDDDENKGSDDGSYDDLNKGCGVLYRRSDDGSDDDLNKGSDFVSSITSAKHTPSATLSSDKDAIEELVADLEERHSFYTVKKEYRKPHKTLAGVDFDPEWNQKINTAPLSRPVDDSPAEEIDSEYDVSSDFESDSPDEGSESPRPSDTNLSKTKLSANIYIEYPKKYNRSVEGTKVVPWPQDRRAAELKDNTLRFAEKMCTDIYQMADTKKQSRVLQFSQTDEALVTFSVKAPDEERAGVGYRYMARIKNKTHWVDRVANCKGDEIKFHATEIESFYIIKIPEKETGL
uniref:Uncharacterized protein LOC111126463 n=1 Tax=Crassostrea virginica TaxID=6565 RepID=A0A8B8DG38_CRAVI|nr:uncharacterized protein LOC111126463 [Crassostrea virginica]